MFKNVTFCSFQQAHRRIGYHHSGISLGIQGFRDFRTGANIYHTSASAVTWAGDVYDSSSVAMTLKMDDRHAGAGAPERWKTESGNSSKRGLSFCCIRDWAGSGF